MRGYAAVCTLVVCLSVGGLFPATAEGAYGGGTGYWQDPFLIVKPAHLLEISRHPEHLDKHFKLTADLNLAGIEWTADHRIGPDWGAPFIGTFDGNGHTIYNLSYSADSAHLLGLFGCMNGTVRNLTLCDVTFTLGTASGVGGLVGEVMGGAVENCHVTYTITTGDNAYCIGGLVGKTDIAWIVNCTSRGTLKAGANSNRIGGLVGQCSAAITNSSASGDVEVGTSSQLIGGLAGEYNGQMGPIEHCYTAGTVTARGTAGTVGGLVGRHIKEGISHCFSVASVHGASNVGGLVGAIEVTTDDTISHCFSTGAVSVSGYYGGGLVGYSSGVKITDCTSSGPVSGPANVHTMGGLIGFSLGNSQITNCSSTGSVTGETGAIKLGGLIGSSANTLIRQCFSSGEVVSGGGWSVMAIGGLVGYQDSGLVENCYSLSRVEGGTNSNRVGGLIGCAYKATVANCFAAGAVLSEGFYAGGLIGESDNPVTTCFWDQETTGKTTSSGGGKGLTTKAMQTQTTFTSAGWDFVNTWKMYAYPGLAWQPDLGMAGTFQVSVAAGDTAVIEFSVFSMRKVTIHWTAGNIAAGGWITSVMPGKGVSSGPADPTTVRLTIDAVKLEAGDYVQTLLITGDNGDTVQVPIRLHVYHPIGLDQLDLLTSHWGTNCDFGQPCKAVDWFVDGAIDLRDLGQLAQGWLSEGIQTIRAEVNEGFERGDFTALDWQKGGETGWQIVSTGAHEGAFAARSGAIGDGQTSVLEVTLDLTGWEVDTIAFAFRTSCEESFDYFRFFIDGVEQFNWSGIWWEYRMQTFPVMPGVRTFKWVYSKDASTVAGEDCAWIDNIRIYAR